MEYTVGQSLTWNPANNFENPTQVEVVELRRGGKAKLSNGWVVDENGVAEGTNRQPGGFVERH